MKTPRRLSLLGYALIVGALAGVEARAAVGVSLLKKARSGSLN